MGQPWRPPRGRLLVVAAGPPRRPPALLAGQRLLALALHRGLLVVRAPLHLLKDAVLQHLLLQGLERGLDLIVEHLDLHGRFTCLSEVGLPARLPPATAPAPARGRTPLARTGYRQFDPDLPAVQV